MISSPDMFSASVVAHGAQVNITATTLGALLKTLGQFGYTEAAPTPEVVKPGKPKPAAPAPVEPAAPSEVPRPETHGEAVDRVYNRPGQVPGKSADAVAEQSSVSTPTSPAATADPASSEPVQPTYDQIRAAVLKLAQVDRTLVVKTLAKFTAVNGQPVDHGNKLQLADYSAFLAAAAEASAK